MMDIVGPLLPNWPDLLQVAASVESPNSEDDERTKAAIVGFSLLSPTEGWTRTHWQFLEDYRESEMAEREDSSSESESSPFQLFECMAVGALLGAFQAEKLSEQEFYMALSQVPEFISQHARDIAEASPAGPNPET